METIDGKYGGNDAGVQYGGPTAMHDVVHGFHEEFWKGVEANQFLHFRDGLFVGQFGVLNHGLMWHYGTPKEGWGCVGTPGTRFRRCWSTAAATTKCS
jgi:hypothetical protein